MKTFLAALFMASAAPVKPVACKANCTVSQDGYELVKHFEGFVPFVYKDVAGKETIGFGHLVRPGEKFRQPMTPAEGTALLQRDMTDAVSIVNRRLPVLLYQGQFDSLVSIAFNIGGIVVTPRTSTLARFVAAEKHESVPDQFLRWNKARVDGNLVEVSGLTRRRKAEAEIYAGKD